MQYRNYLITTALMFTLLAIGYWSFTGSITPGVPHRQVVIREDADYFLVNAKIRQYSEQGSLHYVLTSGSITHYPHNDTTLLNRPVMTSYSKPGEVFRSVSENGKLLPGNKDLELWDDVVMTQTRADTDETVRMTTDFITLYSEQEKADTDRPVLITSKNTVTRATGMTALYGQGIIQLKSRVRGVHEPE